MGTDEPLITILMAVYHPRLDWLIEQLDSLNSQTYPHLELIVCDDGPDVPTDERVFEEHITSFPWRMIRNEENLGSNRSFEKLTALAEGDYFAYCDQDDVWLPEKLTLLREDLERERAELVCSDMSIIDGEGQVIADSITKVRRHHVFHSGEGLASGLLLSNFASGCTMLIRAETAKNALPFCPYMVHDQYLALVSAVYGRIYSDPRPLINYRVHGGNQTGLMAGVHSREDYLELRILEIRKRLEWLSSNLPCRDLEMDREIGKRLKWLLAREQRMQFRRGGAGTIWKYRRFGPRAALFELFAPFLPERAFLFAAELARQNKL